MKVVVALDSFKGSLSANQGCEIVRDVVKSHSADADVVCKPLADGGEGTSEVLLSTQGGEWIEREVMGPLPEMRVKAGFAWFEKSRTALVEMASASGLPLLEKEQLNPMKATTFGTGELIGEAAKLNPQRILLAVGGSATVDGGSGAAKALGWKFLNADGHELGCGGEILQDIATVVKPDDSELPEIDVLCDVDNPLCGAKGAAKVFGPQKGADVEMVGMLEDGLSNLCSKVKQQLGRDMDIKGGGAAGGLSAGAVAFMDAKLVSGIDTVMEFIGLEDAIKDADLIITGEGCFDSQSLDGKVISGVAKLAGKYSKPVVVLAGLVRNKPEVYTLHGIKDAFGCVQEGADLQEAIANAEANLKNAAKRLAEAYI